MKFMFFVFSIFVMGNVSGQLYSPSGAVSPVVNGTTNVGIGTASPGARFEIIKNSTNYLTLFRESPAGNESYFYQTITPGFHLLGSSKNGTGTLKKLGFAIGLNDNESDIKMVINPMGNIGIGTINPGARLEVIQGGNGYAFYYKRVSAGARIILLSKDQFKFSHFRVK